MNHRHTSDCEHCGQDREAEARCTAWHNTYVSQTDDLVDANLEIHSLEKRLFFTTQNEKGAIERADKLEQMLREAEAELRTYKYPPSPQAQPRNLTPSLTVSSDDDSVTTHFRGCYEEVDGVLNLEVEVNRQCVVLRAVDDANTIHRITTLTYNELWELMA